MLAKLLLVACFVAVANAAAASFINKCKMDDYKCQKESTQAALAVFTNGIPEFGIERLDPLHFDKIDATTQELKLILKDVDINGVKDCEIKKIVRDVPNGKLFAKGMCTVVLNGNYEMDGRLLFIPIQGKGKLSAILRKAVVNVEADVVDKVGKDGKTHWDVKAWKHSYELKDTAELDLENLFPGNELLGNAARALLKSNANDVIHEVGAPIIKALLSKVVKVVVKFFREVPVEDLVLQ
ncbi:hypothetical protein NE865_01993 [Phthorimaea operculella]|nr:hypothetical protein NE865_01993 [Phthorimaea operculella]